MLATWHALCVGVVLQARVGSAHSVHLEVSQIQVAPRVTTAQLGTQALVAYVCNVGTALSQIQKKVLV